MIKLFRFPKNTFLTFKLTKKQLNNIKLIIEDGMAFIKNKRTNYDCIIIDSTDPVGQAKILYSKNFIKLCNNSLKKEEH
jgi:spermidine synthase